MGKLKLNNILTIMKLSPFSNSFKNLKELFDLIISKISSDGGYPAHHRDRLVSFTFKTEISGGPKRILNLPDPLQMSSCRLRYKQCLLQSVKKK